MHLRRPSDMEIPRAAFAASPMPAQRRAIDRCVGGQIDGLCQSIRRLLVLVVQCGFEETRMGNKAEITRQQSGGEQSASDTQKRQASTLNKATHTRARGSIFVRTYPLRARYRFGRASDYSPRHHRGGTPRRSTRQHTCRPCLRRGTRRSSPVNRKRRRRWRCSLHRQRRGRHRGRGERRAPSRLPVRLPNARYPHARGARG